MTPLILVVLANDEKRTLDLKEEKNTLRDLFNDPDKLEFRYMNDPDIRDIANGLSPIDKKRTIIFHYAGHANGKNIKLVDGNVQIEGLSRLLKEFENLQLVFLNGCDTYEQAAIIQKEKPEIPVLATLIPVDDQVAIDFAHYFYLAVYTNNSFNLSFGSAQTRMMMHSDVKTNIFIKASRGFGEEEFSIMVDGPGDGKNVYTLSCPGKDCLNKSLQLDLDIEKRNDRGLNYRPNRKLITEIANSILNSNYFDQSFLESEDYTGLKKNYEKYDRSATNENFRDVIEKLLSILPFPVGFHINLLVSNAKDYSASDEKKVDLLKRQIITYNCMVQMLCFILLSCLWIELEKGKALDIQKSQYRMMEDFFSYQDRDSQEVNFAVLLVTLHDILYRNSLDIFVTEYQFLKNIFKDEDSLHKAHLHMQGANASIQNKTIGSQAINEVCMETEEILAQIFAGSGFIVKYKLATIKNIELIKSRLRPVPSYFIKRIILDRFVVVEDDIVEYPVYTNSRSVILAKSMTPAVTIDFLPVSPFIIDENALRGENLAKLYFFSHSLGETYVFRWGEDPAKTLIVKENNTYESIYGKDDEELELVNLRMGEIWKELGVFQKLISGKSE